jgi:ankyrin repeat protein
MLLEANAPVAEKDMNDDEPVHLAAKAGSIAIIKLLKSYGCNVLTPGYRGNHIIHYAAQKGRFELLKFVLSLKNGQQNKRNALTETPLHLASACHTDGESSFYLIKFFILL